MEGGQHGCAHVSPQCMYETGEGSWGLLRSVAWFGSGLFCELVPSVIPQAALGCLGGSVGGRWQEEAPGSRRGVALGQLACDAWTLRSGSDREVTTSTSLSRDTGPARGCDSGPPIGAAGASLMVKTPGYVPLSSGARSWGLRARTGHAAPSWEDGLQFPPRPQAPRPSGGAHLRLSLDWTYYGAAPGLWGPQARWCP